MKDLPSFLVFVTETARDFLRELLRLVEALRLPWFLLRVLHAFLAAAEREALVPLRLLDALRLEVLRLVDALRLDAPLFAAEDLFAAFLLRVLHAFLAAALREALVPLRLEDAFLLEDAFRELRFLVAAAFLPARDLDALFLRLVAAAFLAAAERVALLLLLEDAFRVAGLRFALRFRVAAAFFAAEERFAAFLFLVAAAFFAAADLDAFVPFLAAIFFPRLECLGGLTRMRFVSAIDST